VERGGGGGGGGGGGLLEKKEKKGLAIQGEGKKKTNWRQKGSEKERYEGHGRGASVGWHRRQATSERCAFHKQRKGWFPNRGPSTTRREIGEDEGERDRSCDWYSQKKGRRFAHSQKTIFLEGKNGRTFFGEDSVMGREQSPLIK